MSIDRLEGGLFMFCTIWYLYFSTFHRQILYFFSPTYCYLAYFADSFCTKCTRNKKYDTD